MRAAWCTFLLLLPNAARAAPYPLELLRPVDHGRPATVRWQAGRLLVEMDFPCVHEPAESREGRCPPGDYATLQGEVTLPRPPWVRVEAELPAWVRLAINEVRSSPAGWEVCRHLAFRPLAGAHLHRVVYGVDLDSPCDEVIPIRGGGVPALQLEFSPSRPGPATAFLYNVELSPRAPVSLAFDAPGIPVGSGTTLAQRLGVNLGTVHTPGIDHTITHLDDGDVDRALTLGVGLVRTGQGWSGYETDLDPQDPCRSPGRFLDRPTEEFFQKLRSLPRQRRPRVLWLLIGLHGDYARSCAPPPPRACPHAGEGDCCGNGVRDRFLEECDDGNQVGGDGCSAQCTREDLPWPPLAPDPEACPCYAQGYLRYLGHQAQLVHRLALGDPNDPHDDIEVLLEQWNEPNLHPFWRPGVRPHAHAQLLARAVAVLRDAAPGRPVVVGSLTHVEARPEVDHPYLDSWTQRLRELGAVPGGDLFGYHFYRPYWYYHGRAPANPHLGPQPEYCVDDLLELRHALDAGGLGSLPIVDSEWGYSSVIFGTAEPGDEKLPDGRTWEAWIRQGQVLTRRILVAWALGLEISVIFKIRDSALMVCHDGSGNPCPCFSPGCPVPPWAAREIEWNSGLYDDVGLPKPAAAAVQRLVTRVGHLSTLRLLPTPPPLHVLAFDSPGGPQLAFWSSADVRPGATGGHPPVPVRLPPNSRVEFSDGRPFPVPATGVILLTAADGVLWATPESPRRRPLSKSLPPRRPGSTATEPPWP